jgi:transglutaminase-like putative cysteine protease
VTEVGRIPRGPRALLGTALVALGTCSSVLALNHLIEHGRWLVVAWLTVLVVAAVVAGVRAVARSWWMPSLVGAVVSLALLLVRYGAPPGRIQVIPDPGSFHRALATAHEGVDVINASLVPMPGVRSAELLVVTGALAVFLLADALAIGLGVPALAGIAYGALWVPAVVLGFPAGGWAIALTGVFYLLLLALSVTPTNAATDHARRVSVAVVGAVGLVVVTLVVGPAVAAFPGWASVALPNLGNGPVGPMRLSDDLDLRESLGKRSQQVVLTYKVQARGGATAGVGPTAAPSAAARSATAAPPTGGASQQPSPSASSAPPTVTAHTIGPLRAFTLTSFDGRSWASSSSSQNGATRNAATGQLLSPDPLLSGKAPDPSLGTVADVSLQIGQLRDRHLPISTFARALDVHGSWDYTPATDTVTGSSATTQGMHYAMTVEVPQLTAAELRDASVGNPRDGGATLQLPKTAHSSDVAALARQITRGSRTAYDQALALQQYFRSAQNFTYDTRVAPARSGDAVWDFLQSKHGYCVQFATSMVVMARDLGIPARLGVGFLPGDLSGNDSGIYSVTGQDSHAWPELYFEGYGWVRFEPTPAVQTGAPPTWSDPYANVGNGSTVPGDIKPTGESSVAPNTAPTGHTTTAPVATASTPWLAVGVTTALVLLVATVVIALVVRRRFVRGPVLTPERAWSRARRKLADLGVTWSDSDTPRTASVAVLRQVEERAGRPAPDHAERALRALATTVERVRYAPTPPDVIADDLEAWVDELVTGVGATLSDRSRRDGAPTAPRADS